MNNQSQFVYRGYLDNQQHIEIKTVWLYRRVKYTTILPSLEIKAIINISDKNLRRFKISKKNATLYG